MVQFNKGDVVIQHTPPEECVKEYDTGDKVMTVAEATAYGLRFENDIGGSYKADRYRHATIGELEKSNVKNDAKISAASTKDTNPKDAIGDKKVPMWLLSPIAKAQWAVAQFVGMTKYGAWNWRAAGVRTSVYLSAMQRHIDAYLSGEEVDPVDQTPHLGHIMACAAILIDAKAAGKLTDDRPPSVDLRQVFAETEAQMQIAVKNYGHMKPKNYTIADTKVTFDGLDKALKNFAGCDHDFTKAVVVPNYTAQEIQDMLVQGRDRY